jgi:hypothetical protein
MAGHGRSVMRVAGLLTSLITVVAWVVLATPLRAQAPVPGPGEQLLERTVAIVGGAVVTQSDVDTAVRLGLVEMGAGTLPARATGAVIERWLMLHEVARFSPAEPDPAAVASRVTAVRLHVGGEEPLAAALVAGGFTPARLSAWLRDDLRIAAYLDQRFASAGVPPDADVTAYLEAHRAELAQDGVAPAALTEAARERLVAGRRRDLISDWLADLRRRTEVVEFRRDPG